MFQPRFSCPLKLYERSNIARTAVFHDLEYPSSRFRDLVFNSNNRVNELTFSVIAVVVCAFSDCLLNPPTSEESESLDEIIFSILYRNEIFTFDMLKIKTNIFQVVCSEYVVRF